MEFEFDKEIDAILRKARTSDFAFEIPNAKPRSSNSLEHLDADEISAFAENVLPVKTRQIYTAHLAECARCRKILSNVILFNAEAETEIKTVAVSASETTAQPFIPWYRRLFAFPQIAYVMGALALLFTGFFGYLVMKNLDSGADSQLSQTTDKPLPATEPRVSTVANTTANSAMSPTANTNSVSPSTAANTAPSANAPVPMATPNLSSSNNSVGRSSSEDSPIRDGDRDAKSLELSKEDTKKLPTDDGKISQLPQAVKKPLPEPENKPAAEAQKDKPKNANEEVPGAGGETTTDMLKTERKRSAPSMPKQKEQAETRQIGGKTFRRTGGIWFDSAYNNKQTQISVRRGTSEYQNLEAGLRAITDQLDGTVIIAWKSKAYRIQ